MTGFAYKSLALRPIPFWLKASSHSILSLLHGNVRVEIKNKNQNEKITNPWSQIFYLKRCTGVGSSLFYNLWSLGIWDITCFPSIFFKIYEHHFDDRAMNFQRFFVQRFIRYGFITMVFCVFTGNRE